MNNTIKNLEALVMSIGYTLSVFARQYNLCEVSVRNHARGRSAINKDNYLEYKDIFNSYNIAIPPYKEVEVSLKLRILRESLGYSVHDIGALCNTTGKTVCCAELNTYDNDALVKAMLKVYGYTPEEYNNLDITTLFTLYEIYTERNVTITAVLKYMRTSTGFTARAYDKKLNKYNGFVTGTENTLKMTFHTLITFIDMYGFTIEDFINLYNDTKEGGD